MGISLSILNYYSNIRFINKVLRDIRQNLSRLTIEEVLDYILDLSSIRLLLRLEYIISIQLILL